MLEQRQTDCKEKENRPTDDKLTEIDKNKEVQVINPESQQQIMASVQETEQQGGHEELKQEADDDKRQDSLEKESVHGSGPEQFSLINPVNCNCTADDDIPD